MACGASCKVPVKYSQFLYFVGFILTAIASWSLRDYGGSALDFSPLNKCIDTSQAQATSCLGQQAVQRISFGTFLFFALHLVLLLGVTTSSNPRLVLHTGFWPIKFLLWGGLIAATFAMPNTALNGYAQAARAFSGIFIILQLLILVEFVYVANEWLLKQEGRWAAATLVAGSALMIAGAFVGVGFLYHYYAPSSSCSLNIWFITSTFLFFLFYGGISISPIRNESAGLFTSAAVFAYCTYYIWSALNSEPASEECAALSAGANKTIEVVGFVLAILALGFSTMSSGISSEAFDLSKGTGTDDDQLRYRPDFFHAIFMLAAADELMLFNGWDLTKSQSNLTLDQGWGSTWVKATASWLCVALYTWSLVAHRILHNREF